MDGLRALLTEAADTEARMRVLNSLQQANGDILRALAGDAPCLRALNLWLLDLLPDTRAFHVLQVALKVMLAHSLPCPGHGVLGMHSMLPRQPVR
jgi:hypothetical protein